MEVPIKRPDALDMRTQRRTADDLVHLIRKLRWIGMDDEAEAMQAQLADCRVPPRESVIASPRDTD